MRVNNKRNKGAPRGHDFIIFQRHIPQPNILWYSPITSSFAKQTTPSISNTQDYIVLDEVLESEFISNSIL